EAVLGSLLRWNGGMGDAASRLRPEDFYRDAHQTIYRLMLELWDQGKPFDAVILADLLHARGQMENLGGQRYLGRLWETVAHGGLVTHYAECVRDHSLLRQLGHAAA